MLPSALYTDVPPNHAFYDTLVGRLQRVSGVQSVAVTDHLPTDRKFGPVTVVAHPPPDAPPEENYRYERFGADGGREP